MKRAPAEYVRFDPFGDDRDVDIRCQTIKLVKTRKRQVCVTVGETKPHTIEPGETVRFEKALVEGAWRSYYLCLSCMDKWMDQWERTEDEPASAV